jgi:hypothetical protein
MCCHSGCGFEMRRLNGSCTPDLLLLAVTEKLQGEGSIKKKSKKSYMPRQKRERYQDEEKCG